MKVILYTTHCPKCAVIEKKLGLAGIQFDVCEDVELMKARGWKKAPILEVDGQAMEFGDAAKWINTLKEGN